MGADCCPAHVHLHLRFTVRCPPPPKQLSTARAQYSTPNLSPPQRETAMPSASGPGLGRVAG
eukprot:60341-Prymnesium_polylepis.1